MAYIDIALTDDDKDNIAKAVALGDKEAITQMVKKVGLSVSDVQTLSNPLISAFQGEDIPFGGLIEHYDFASLAQQKALDVDPNRGKIGLLKFDYDPNSQDLWIPKKVSSTADYNQVSLKVKVPASLYDRYTYEAFDSQGKLSTYVASWIRNFNNKVFLYKYSAVEALVAKGAGLADIFTVISNNEAPIGDSTDIYADATIAHVKRLIFDISRMAYNFVSFPSDKWNMAHHDKQTPSVGRLVLLLNGSKLSQAFNVALSTVYNYSLVDIRNIRTIVVEDGVLPSGVEAMLVDSDFFRVHNATNETLTQPDIDNRSTKFIHHWQAYLLYNPNYNACVFKAVAPSKPSAGK